MKKLFSFLFIFLLAATVSTTVVNAQGLKNALKELNKTATPAGVSQNASLSDVIGTVINVALSLVGIIFLLLMVYGGYLWLTSQGEESQIDKAKDIIKSAIIGLVIVMSAYAITVLVTSRFSPPPPPTSPIPMCNSASNTFEDCRGQEVGRICGTVAGARCADIGSGQCTCSTP